MSVTNLHSLFNRPWYIDQNYAQGHLPLLMGILEGNAISEKETDKKKSLIQLSNVNSKAPLGTATTSKTVAVLNIKNPIVKHDQFCGPQGTKSMMRELEGLKNNDAVAGVVLDIDSGGGQAYGTPEFYDFLMDYPKPVVAYTDGLMCSAAYYIGCAADEIVVNKRAEAIGSIGAYSQLVDFSGYYKKQGLKVHTMYATKSTEKNYAHREAMKGEEFYDAYIKTELDPLVDNFISDMKSSRPNINETVFKGATYGGEKAVEMGLADSLGDLNNAIQRVFDLSETKNSKNSNTMSKSYNKIESVIGATFGEGETANGLFLDEAQADAVETRISALEGEVETATTAQQTAETALEEETTANQAFVDAANAELELTGDDAVTNVAGVIAAYQSKITDLGEQPGAMHTHTGDFNEDDSPHAGMDFNTPFYKKTQELLK